MVIGCDSCIVEMLGLYRKDNERKYFVSMVLNKFGY